MQPKQTCGRKLRPGESIRLDLSADRATYTVRRIDAKTGQAVPSGAVLRGGQVVDLPAPASTSGPGAWSPPIASTAMVATS